MAQSPGACPLVALLAEASLVEVLEALRLEDVWRAAAASRALAGATQVALKETGRWRSVFGLRRDRAGLLAKVRAKELDRDTLLCREAWALEPRVTLRLLATRDRSPLERNEDVVAFLRFVEPAVGGLGRIVGALEETADRWRGHALAGSVGCILHEWFLPMSRLTSHPRAAPNDTPLLELRALIFLELGTWARARDVAAFLTWGIGGFFDTELSLSYVGRATLVSHRWADRAKARSLVACYEDLERAYWAQGQDGRKIDHTGQPIS